MLKQLDIEQARFIALLGRTARMQRDSLLGHAAERNLGGMMPGRGEHNPTAELGFDPLPAEDSQIAALREAIASLSAGARQELYALMRIGQGHLAVKQWHLGLTEAQALGENATTAAISGDADLHDHIAKGLFEAGLVS